MGSLATNYLFAGQQYDSATGLYSMRARYYDPGVGRFLSRDTWAINYANPVELNRYVYAANNPVRWSDPSGNSILQQVGSIITSVMQAMQSSAGLRVAVGASFGGVLGGLTADYLYREASEHRCPAYESIFQSMTYQDFVGVSILAGAISGALYASGFSAALVSFGRTMGLVGVFTAFFNTLANPTQSDSCNNLMLLGSIYSVLTGGGVNPTFGGTAAALALSLEGAITVIGNGVVVVVINGLRIVVKVPQSSTTNWMFADDANSSDSNNSGGQNSDTDSSPQATPTPDIGVLREEYVAQLVGGTRTAGTRIRVPGVGSTDIDVRGPNNEIIGVGGANKGNDLSTFGTQLRTMQALASNEGVQALFYFDNSNVNTTNQAAFNSAVALAQRRLGAQNVFVFTLPPP